MMNFEATTFLGLFFVNIKTYIIKIIKELFEAET